MLPVYVANAKEIEATAAAIAQKFGAIDVWVNNAMVSVFSPVKEMTSDEFRRYRSGLAFKRMLSQDFGPVRATI